MGKLKAGVSILITALLIVAFALMPHAIAVISDFVENEKPGTAPMQSVELSLGSNRMEEPGYMMRKLALEQRMTSIPVDSQKTQMNEDEVLTVAQTGMDIYIDASMFEWFEISHCTAEPYLAVDPEVKSNHSIFWAVSFVYDADPYQSLFLHIDDETGKIIYIAYETFADDQFRYYGPENQRLMMEGLVNSFFDPLNLNDRSEYENLLGESVIEQDLTDDVTCVVYTFEDAEYGTIYVAFHISPEGFRVYCPSV